MSKEKEKKRTGVGGASRPTSCPTTTDRYDIYNALERIRGVEGACENKCNTGKVP